MLSVGLQGKRREKLEMSRAESDNEVKGEGMKGGKEKGEMKSKCIYEFEFSNELKIF